MIAPKSCAVNVLFQIKELSAPDAGFASEIQTAPDNNFQILISEIYVLDLSQFQQIRDLGFPTKCHDMYTLTVWLALFDNTCSNLNTCDTCFCLFFICFQFLKHFVRNMNTGNIIVAMSIFGKSYGTKISGQVFMNGKEVKLNTVQEAIDNKLAYVTEDRKGNGLILSKSIKMNTSLANMRGITNGKVIDADKEYAVAEEYRKKLKTKCPSVEQNVGNLSGGNQQKVLLAKWMFAEPDILILDEPTRGIDVGAKYEIYCIINDLVAAGKSVIMISSELPEVLGMSDRIYIMNEGRFVGEVGKEEATSELIMSKIVKSGKGA